VVSATGLEDEEEPSGAEVIDLIKILRERLAAGKPSTHAAPRAQGPVAGKARGDDRLEDLSRSELYERAKALDIPDRSKMSKARLIDALRDHGS
jgi:DNA end-binding protein Ku